MRDQAAVVLPGTPVVTACDNLLAARARDGDRHAFEALVARHQQSVFAYVVRLLGDRDLADDATQEAFIAAFRSIDGFRGGHFRRWLIRIAHNKALDQLRARRRRNASSLERDEAPEPAALGPEAWADRAGLTELLQAALATLPADQRATVLLRATQDLTYDEVATVLRVDLGAVKSRLARGRRRLRDFLSAHRELLPSDVRLDA
ncbi:MAG: sigma-70 family RNA polymerase sigma factor [Actinobacteria bacterium]|nr:sigma-70 family RNA polymerase sigma factor [Actinomycetota bacterium]